MEQYFSSRFSGKFPGAKEYLKQVVMFFRSEPSKRKFMFHFFKANFDTSFVYALEAVFRQMELICANDTRDSGTKFTNPKFCLSFAFTNREPIGKC